MVPDALPDPIAVAVHFTAILERLGIRHLVGGSLASSVHGEPRSTNDIDVLADFREEHVEPFVDRRGGETSERQWRDVVSILRVQRTRLDRARLDTWAARLGVSDLLERARAEAGARPS